MIDKKELRKDIDEFYQMSMSGICHCYDNVNGLFPDNCDCMGRKKVAESISLLINKRKDIINKYNLHDVEDKTNS